MKLQDLSSNDAKVTDALMRIRKSSSVSPKQIALAATVVGWTVEERMTTYQHMYLNNSSKFNGMMGCDYGDFHVFENRTDPVVYSIECKTAEVASKVHTAFEKMLVGKLPDKISRKDTVFILNLGDVENTKRDYAPFQFECEIWFATKGMFFTSTEGNTDKMIVPIDSLGFDTYKFQARPLYKQLKTNVIDFLGLGTVEQEREKKHKVVKLQRMGENSGHCAICGGLQKLRKQNGMFVMVHHGYQRPGHGYLVGDCFGVAYQPYEKSADACVDYVPKLESTRKHYEAQLKKHTDGEITNMFITKRNAAFKLEQVKITPEDTEWKETMKVRILNFENQIRYIDQDIAMFKKRITDWQEKPLPFEEFTK